MGVTAAHHRRAAIAVAALLAAATTPLTASAGAAKGRLSHIPCEEVAASPSFATDRTLFCAAPTQDATGVDFYRSTDAGHTWVGPTAVERGSRNDFPMGIFPSPNYVTDHTVYVGTYTGGYVSTDSGATFTAPVTGASDFNPVTASTFLDGTPGGAVTRPELITGVTGSIYDPVLPPRQATHVPLSSGERYIIPPDFPSTHQSVMLGYPYSGPSQVAPPWHARAYSCTAEFACDTVLYDFPPRPGDDVSGFEWSGPTYYPSSSDNYAVIGSGRSGAVTYTPTPDRIFRSADYGHTWALWTSASKLLAPGYGNVQVYINASPDAPHRLFLHLTGAPNPTVPGEQLFRSDDNGTTWHRVGCAWGPDQKPRYRCALPFNTTPAAYGTTVVEPGGRLYLVAEHDTGKHVDFVGLYCSRDYGAHWSTNC